MATKRAPATKTTNYGRGWWFHFKDGYKCWMLGMSRNERLIHEREHGKLMTKTPA